MVRRLNNALLRADRIEWAEGKDGIDYLLPIVADAEAGFGGPLNAFELMKGMIEAGAAAVHFEDQLASEKKCGHLGGKVLVPTRQFIRTLLAARLAADVLGVPTLVVARTDADSAKLLTSDADEYDHAFLTGERSPEGFYFIRDGVEAAIARGLAYAPYADLVWMETSTPDLGEAREFAEAIHEKFPGKLLAYNCSPSFNWRRHLDDETIERFQRELGAMGYRFQFITLAGFHALNESMFELARGYAAEGCRRTCGCRSGSSRSRTSATRRPSTSARSARAGSTRSRRPSPAARARPSPSAARPRRRSSRTATASRTDRRARRGICGGSPSAKTLKAAADAAGVPRLGMSQGLSLGHVPVGPVIVGLRWRGAPRIRVLVVDDHVLFTQGLTAVLEQDGRFDVVGTAATGREAVRLAKNAAADVVLMDMSMPVLDGPAATRRLLALDHGADCGRPQRPHRPALPRGGPRRPARRPS